MLWGRLLAVLAVAATTAAPALIATPAAASPRIASPRIAWGPCADPAFAAAGAECGSLAVPLAYDDPSGPRVEIALSRVRHRVPDAQYQGVLITVAGGPGGSGLQTFTASGPRVPDHAAEAYDWVSFDARGVGASRPALSCDPDYMDYRRPDYVPTTEKLEQTWLTRVRRYAQDCGAKNDPALLANIKTADTARDIDAIRAALGVSRVTLYGISYGTYVLQVYGTLFPTRVRRMVLDSTVDPRYVFYQVNLNQDVAMNRNLGAWMEWTARYDQVYHLGTTAAAVRKVYDAQFSRLRATPAGGLVGPDELTDIFVIAEYGQSGWPTVADVFARLVRGDWQPAKELFDAVGGRGNDNGYAVYLATQCTDVQWPTDWNRWHADNWRTYPQASDFTWMNAWYNAPCIAWPARAGTPVTIDGKGVPSVLMVGEEYDGATPFPGSIEVRKRFPGASLILEPGGTSHAASLSGNPCVDPAIARYLLTGERPPRKPGDGPDALCAPLPEPVPPSA